MSFYLFLFNLKVRERGRETESNCPCARTQSKCFSLHLLASRVHTSWKLALGGILSWAICGLYIGILIRDAGIARCFLTIVPNHKSRDGSHLVVGYTRPWKHLVSCAKATASRTWNLLNLPQANFKVDYPVGLINKVTNIQMVHNRKKSSPLLSQSI